MLDSTGPHYIEKVFCFVCNNNVAEFEVYKPEYGHCSEKLNLPPCILLNYKLNEICKRGVFYLVNEKGELGEPYPFRVSNDAYHYSGLLLPPLGFGRNPGQVAFCCENCKK
ncbi:MAG: hypothetical protein AAB847_02965 [Patescibacteria group bacterium]